MKTNILCILDGYGLGKNDSGNAAFLANTPALDSLKTKYPMVKLCASGNAVGLPNGQMGNSEVGHLNIGAGRVVNQMLRKINLSFKENKFKDIKEVSNLMLNNEIHLIGLVSDGGVHSSIDHMLSIIKMLKNKKV